MRLWEMKKVPPEQSERMRVFASFLIAAGVAGTLMKSFFTIFQEHTGAKWKSPSVTATNPSACSEKPVGVQFEDENQGLGV